jgi:D-amino-acid dehydrogenase
MTSDSRRAVVIGGGVIGAACAYFLARSGWSVTVADRGGFGKGCSYGNCGLVSPSHVLPLAAPGAIRGALKAMLQPNSPFAIKPRFDPALWAWLLRFACNSTTRRMLEGGRAIQALLDSSRALYAELMANEPFECEWDTRGMLLVFLTKAALEHYDHTAQLLRDRFHVNAVRYEGEALLALEPALKSGLAGAWHFPSDAQLRPDRLMASWRRILMAHGVEIRENCEVNGFAGEHGRARAAITSSGELPAGAFVVAAGALTPWLNRALGCRIPIQPGKGYSMTMPRPAKCPTIPLIFEQHRVGVTPMQSGYRLGSTMEFAGYDSTLNPRRLALLRDGARHYLQEPYTEPVEEEWCGWRPMTPDSVPIIDRSAAHANVLIAAGHNMLGVSMSPATGKLVAELVDRQKPHIDPAPYSCRRFDRWF